MRDTGKISQYDKTALFVIHIKIRCSSSAYAGDCIFICVSKKTNTVNGI